MINSQIAIERKVCNGADTTKAYWAGVKAKRSLAFDREESIIDTAIEIMLQVRGDKPIQPDLFLHRNRLIEKLGDWQPTISQGDESCRRFDEHVKAIVKIAIEESEWLVRKYDKEILR